MSSWWAQQRFYRVIRPERSRLKHPECQGPGGCSATLNDEQQRQHEARLLAKQAEVQAELHRLGISQGEHYLKQCARCGRESAYEAGRLRRHGWQQLTRWEWLCVRCQAKQPAG